MAGRGERGRAPRGREGRMRPPARPLPRGQPRRTLRARDAARRRRPRHAPRARRQAARGGCAGGGTSPQGQARRPEAQVLRRPGVAFREGETFPVSDGRVGYFAYGSNMEKAPLRGRRGIEPLRALGARAAGWQLVLDKPPLMPVGEAFANIVPDARDAVLGVLYELTPADWEHVELNEGVRIGNYRSVTVRASTLAGPALVSPPLLPRAQAKGMPRVWERLGASGMSAEESPEPKIGRGFSQPHAAVITFPKPRGETPNGRGSAPRAGPAPLPRRCSGPA